MNNVNTNTRSLKALAGRRRSAFTLIEVLVVIAIMAVLAAMTVALVGTTGDQKKISVTRAELQKLVTLIEGYKHKTGVYPPHVPGRPTTNTLFYELVGATNFTSGGAVTYYLPIGPTITDSQLQNAFGIKGIINSAEGNLEDWAQVQRLLREVRSTQTNMYVPGTVSLVVPVDGPNGETVNPWHYAAGNDAVHNPGHYDLWAEIKVKNGKKVIGNWKD